MLTHAARAKVVVKCAKTGAAVVRLMAGDPFLYASGPEEAQACLKADIGFELVPGVSAVNAVPAYAGIPLTTQQHREVAVVACGPKIDWSTYGDDRTLVLLSAVGQIAAIATELIAAGRSGDTPVAVTRVGTTTNQVTLTTTLDCVGADVHDWQRPGDCCGRKGRRSAADTFMVRDEAVVRLASARAAHQGAERVAVTAFAWIRFRARRGADDLR